MKLMKMKHIRDNKVKLLTIFNKLTKETKQGVKSKVNNQIVFVYLAVDLFLHHTNIFIQGLHTQRMMSSLHTGWDDVIGGNDVTSF